MRVKRKHWDTFIPKPLEEVWHFFSRPENLNDLTPEDVQFNMISDLEGVEMYQGMLIEYFIAPLAGIPMYWMTEITQIEKGRYFIDEQRYGPYSLWHHEHWFEPVDGGVQMRDILYYKIPFGPIGTLADRILVGKKVEGIFDYREEAVKRLF